jgi:hypothetical protein
MSLRVNLFLTNSPASIVPARKSALRACSGERNLEEEGE